MNKQLFGGNPKSTHELSQEYHTWVEETAKKIVRSYGEDTAWEKIPDLEKKAQQEAEWSSWVVSASRRNFAWHCACHAVNPNHTMGGIRPTATTATIAIAKHVVQRAHELYEKVKCSLFRLRFKLNQRFLTISDVDPRSDDETTTYQATDRRQAMTTVSDFYQSYLKMQIDPPVIELVGYDDQHRILEEAAISCSICNIQLPKVGIKSEYQQ